MKDNQIKFVNSLKMYKGEEYLLRYLIYITSAVLRKVKPAELVTFKNKNSNSFDIWKEHGEYLQKILGILCMKLYEDEDNVSLLFYNIDELSDVLVQNNSSPLLVNIGYPADGSVHDMLLYLKNRFDIRNFPHEIGIFLGYPACDVEAFVENEAKNYNHCRYWKVYHNLEEAQKIIDRIDNARQFAAELLLKLAANKTIQILCS